MANKRNQTPLENKIAVSMPELQSLFSLGKATLNKTALECDAVIKIGRRNLYNVQKIKRHLGI